MVGSDTYSFRTNEDTTESDAELFQLENHLDLNAAKYQLESVELCRREI